MAIFTIQAPDGRKIDIQAADEANALRGAQEWAAANPPPPPKPYTVKAEVGGAVDQLKSDARKAYTAAPEEKYVPVSANASVMDKALEWLSGAKRPGAANPGGARAGAADRVTGDVVNAAVSPVRATVTKYVNKPLSAATGIPEDIIGATETAGLIALGSRSGAPANAAVRTGKARVAGAAITQAADQPMAMVLKRQDPAAMRAKAAEYRAAGIDPTLTDVVDESGRGMIRAAGSKMTPGRQLAQDFGDKRALDLPDRLGKQARRVMSSDPRTPDAIAADIAKARKAEADQQYGAVRDQTFAMPEETSSALRTDHGREAIKEAVRRERNPETRAALNRLSEAALDAPSTPITVGMADGVAQVLYGKARAAAQAGDNTLSGFLTGLADDVRNPAVSAHPGYGKAVENYAAHSRAIEAAGQGEDFLKRNTDEFVAGVKKMKPDELTLARATGRRAVERAAGESQGAAPGVARRLADAPEQQARNAALLGPDAPRLQDAMRLEERAVQNGRQIAPKTGSWSANNLADIAKTGGEVAKVGLKGLRDPIGGAWDAGMLFLKSRGMSDAQAEQIVRLATDPAHLDRALAHVRARYGPAAANTLRDKIRNSGANHAVRAGSRAGAVTLAGTAPGSREASSTPTAQR